MASLIRPSIIRQACIALPAKRVASTQTSPIALSAFSTFAAPRTLLGRSQLFKSAFVRESVPRVTAFHSTAKRDILPPLPQTIQGTANEAAPVPPPSPAHGNYHWDFERLVSVALIPVTIAPFVGGSLNPVLDATLCGLLVIHSHIGFQSCIIDYFPNYRVPKIRKGLEWALLGSSLAVAYALYEFETNDVGLTAAVKRVWQA